MYVYIYTERKRDRDRQRERPRERPRERERDFEKLPYVIMEVENFQDLPFANWKPMKANDVIQSEYEVAG